MYVNISFSLFVGVLHYYYHHIHVAMLNSVAIFLNDSHSNEQNDLYIYFFYFSKHFHLKFIALSDILILVSSKNRKKKILSSRFENSFP